jgi:hypothetical protein
MKNVTRKLAVFMLLLGIVLSMPFVAYALNWGTHITSRPRTFTVQNVQYRIQAHIWCFGPGDMLAAAVSIETVCRTYVRPNTMRGQVTLFDTLGNRRAVSQSLWNDVYSRGMNVSTNSIFPNNTNTRFEAIGDVLIEHHGLPHIANTGMNTYWTPAVTRGPQANIQAAMYNFERAYAVNGMVEVVGINNVRGMSFAREIRNATIGYIHVYAGYCLTVVDRFPILPAVMQHLE